MRCKLVCPAREVASGSKARVGVVEKSRAGTMIDSFTDDIEWHVSGRTPVAGDYSGRKAVLGFFQAMMDLYGGTLELDVVDVLANDDHGIVLTKERGKYAGKAVEYGGVHRGDFRDGNRARFENYYDDTYHEFWTAAA
jgi:ketosteroid isomerase-like protein